MATKLAGDVIYASDLNEIDAGSVSAPICQLIQQTAQTGWTSGTPTAVTFGSGSETVDTHNAHDVSTNNSRITIGVKLGWWLVAGIYVPVAQNNTTLVRAMVAKNGTTLDGSFSGLPFNVAAPPGSSLIAITTHSILVEATSASDYVELQGYQTASSGSIGTAVNSYARCSFTATWVRNS